MAGMPRGHVAPAASPCPQGQLKILHCVYLEHMCIISFVQIPRHWQTNWIAIRMSCACAPHVCKTFIGCSSRGSFFFLTKACWNFGSKVSITAFWFKGRRNMQKRWGETSTTLVILFHPALYSTNPLVRLGNALLNARRFLQSSKDCSCQRIKVSLSILTDLQYCKKMGLLG